MPHQDAGGLSQAEVEEVEELAAPRAPVIYEVVRRQGEEELRRPCGSLFWSGLAGGMAIMFSVIGQGGILYKLPPGLPWREAVADLGYSLGFILVVLGRMQLFTEQTIVAVLPIMAAPTWRKLAIVARLWSIVFIANMIGACAAAVINVQCHVVDPAMLGAMLDVSRPLLHATPMTLLVRGVPAGFPDRLGCLDPCGHIGCGFLDCTGVDLGDRARKFHTCGRRGGRSIPAGDLGGGELHSRGERDHSPGHDWQYRRRHRIVRTAGTCAGEAGAVTEASWRTKAAIHDLSAWSDRRRGCPPRWRNGFLQPDRSLSLARRGSKGVAE